MKGTHVGGATIQPLLCELGYHRWTRWQAYNRQGLPPTDNIAGMRFDPVAGMRSDQRTGCWQTRICNRCGQRQDKASN